MKKILLVGDSIRAGYDSYVKMALEGVAEVYYPWDNCRFTSYVLRNLLIWKDELKLEGIDLIHWNAGLWDTLYMHDGKPLISLSEYKENIHRICKVMGILFPGAKMIFATSTPVQEELFGELKRYNKDIEAYNAAAIEIVSEYGATINDLYSTMAKLPKSYHSDLTHYYTKEGTQVITDQVLSHLEKALDIKAKPLDYDALFAEKEEIIGM